MPPFSESTAAQPPNRPHSLHLYNLGLPVLMLTLPGSVLLLPVVILIEALIYHRRLRLGYWSTAGWVTLANVASTVVGVPVGWGLYYVLGGLLAEVLPHGTAAIGHWWSPAVYVLTHGAWMFSCPSGHDSTLATCQWVVPVAIALALLPALPFSVLIEGLGIEGLDLDRQRASVLPTRGEWWRLVWKANLASYGLLWGVCGILLAMTVWS